MLKLKFNKKHWLFVHVSAASLPPTCVREGPGPVDEDDVRRQQHYEDPVGQRDQATVPLRTSLREAAAEQQVETQPANQAADHL